MIYDFDYDDAYDHAYIPSAGPFDKRLIVDNRQCSLHISVASAG